MAEDIEHQKSAGLHVHGSGAKGLIFLYPEGTLFCGARRKNGIHMAKQQEVIRTPTPVAGQQKRPFFLSAGKNTGVTIGIFKLICQKSRDFPTPVDVLRAAVGIDEDGQIRKKFFP